MTDLNYLKRQLRDEEALKAKRKRPKNVLLYIAECVTLCGICKEKVKVVAWSEPNGEVPELPSAWNCSTHGTFYIEFGEVVYEDA